MTTELSSIANGNGHLAGIDGVLVHLEEAATMLAKARTFKEYRAVREDAESIRKLLKQRDYGMELQNDAAEIKLRAERGLGEFLLEMPKHNGDPSSHDVRRYQDYDIEYMQASRWQSEARIPVEQFEGYIAKTKDDGKELTTAGVLKLAKQLNQPGKQDAAPLEDGCTTDDLHRLVEAGKTFGCIYADPPWQYDNQATRASTDNHYVTMTVSDIAKLPIDAIAAPTAHLHLWTTKGFLPDALDIIRQWGFTYKGWFVWCKHQMGLGNYWRSATELMLLAVRGDDATFRDKGLMDWGAFKRGKHSAKPAEIRGFIERGSSGPYLELFGRRKVKGWTVWGNEIKGEEFRQEAFV